MPDDKLKVGDLVRTNRKGFFEIVKIPNNSKYIKVKIVMRPNGKLIKSTYAVSCYSYYCNKVTEEYISEMKAADCQKWDALSSLINPTEANECEAKEGEAKEGEESVLKLLSSMGPPNSLKII